MPTHIPDPRRFGVRRADLVYRPRDAAYAVVFDDRMRVACVNEDSGLFLPGGGLEPGEDSLEAVHREVAEECARSLEILAPLDPAIQFFVAPATGEAYELRASFFLGRFLGSLESAPQLDLQWHAARPDVPALF